jgi:hypothetical protein
MAFLFIYAVRNGSREFMQMPLIKEYCKFFLLQNFAGQFLQTRCWQQQFLTLISRSLAIRK